MLGVTTNALSAAANLLLSAQTHAMFAVAGQIVLMASLHHAKYCGEIVIVVLSITAHQALPA